jgi:hypothetical protein
VTKLTERQAFKNLRDFNNVRYMAIVRGKMFIEVRLKNKRGVTAVALKQVGKVPSEKQRFAS